MTPAVLLRRSGCPGVLSRSSPPSSSLREELQPNGWVRIEILTFAPQYLTNWLLSFGTKLRVEHPPDAKERLQAEARAILSQYDE